MSARINSKNKIKECISPLQWESNKRLVDNIVDIIKSHPIHNHRIVQELNNQSLNIDQLILTHSEFKYTFSEPFTDLLLNLMLKSKCLGERIGNIDAVIAARSLIQVNLLDELGFQPGKENEDYLGNPSNAHYAQLCSTMKSLNITEDNYIPSTSAVKIRNLLEASVELDLAVGASLLYASESIFPLFANTFARNLSSVTKHDISKDFHSIHADDEIGNNIEHDHAGDCLTVLILAITKNKSFEVKYHTLEFLNLLLEFSDNIINMRS